MEFKKTEHLSAGEKKNKVPSAAFHLKDIVQTAVLVLVIIAVAALFFQNKTLLKQIDKVLGESQSEIHELYDTGKIVEAYKSEDTSDDENLSQEDAFVLETARKVIKDVIKDDMSDYEKEKAIYDWQVEWVSYQDQNLSAISGSTEKDYLPYGVLKYHRAICVGNATTFKMFMDMLDIPCRIIHSTAEGEHAWNIVQLDGQWYHCDVTFDGGSGKQPGYASFNVPDSIKDDGSYKWDHDEIPAATGTKYCYKLNQASDLKNIYEIPKAIKKAADKGRAFAAFTLKDPSGFTRETADYIANGLYIENGSLYYEDAYVLGDKTVYCYAISLNEDESVKPESNPEAIEKLSKIMEKLNGGFVPAVDDAFKEDIKGFEELK